MRGNNFKKNQRDDIKDLLTITIENEQLQKFQLKKKRVNSNEQLQISNCNKKIKCYTSKNLLTTKEIE